jgi:hypothetical protein
MPDTHGPGSYWRDPARAAQARQAMKDAWAARRHFVVFGKAMPRTRVTTPQEVEARFAQHDGTQLFVRRVYRRTYGQV